MARHHDNARERVLDCFEDLLIELGDSRVTLEGVATHADLTKGGLLYHFPSRAALVSALTQRFEERARDDLTAMIDAPGGAARDYLEVSNYLASPLHRTTLAMSQLSNREPEAAAALGRSRTGELAAILADLGDPILARLTMLVADGLYYQAMTAPSTSAENGPVVAWFTEQLLARVERRGRP